MLFNHLMHSKMTNIKLQNATKSLYFPTWLLWMRCGLRFLSSCYSFCWPKTSHLLAFALKFRLLSNLIFKLFLKHIRADAQASNYFSLELNVSFEYLLFGSRLQTREKKFSVFFMHHALPYAFQWNKCFRTGENCLKSLKTKENGNVIVKM